MNLLAPAVAFVDLETTGTSATGDRVTEVAIVRVVEGELVEEWSSLVDPERSIPPDIQVLTGITNEMVKGAPTFADIRHEVLPNHLRERREEPRGKPVGQELQGPHQVASHPHAEQQAAGQAHTQPLRQ